MAYAQIDEFIQICIECDYNTSEICKTLKSLYPAQDVRPYKIEQRIANCRRKGLLPLPSGNSVAPGQLLRSTSTLYDDVGNVKLQWIKSDSPREEFLEAYKTALSELAAALPAVPTVAEPTATMDDLATLYISNDVHFGALMWDKESGDDYNIDIARTQIYEAYDHLFASSPSSRVGIVVDLGDLLEADNNKNMTPKSGNVLSVDSRYPKVLRVAYEALIYAVTKALTKHEIVYFYNIEGNHDLNTGHAIREVIRVAFANNPRVFVSDSPAPIKYHQHGQVLLQFAHGDGMKMRQAGEVMAHDCQSIFSETRYRFSHFGHTHVDSVYDGKICRVESHRNLAPNNHWAHHMGYRRQPGTMKSITYHNTKGEIARNLFTL